MRRDAATNALVAPYLRIQGTENGVAEHRTGPWLLTFVDLTLQLLAFFVLINALSTFEASRVGPVLDSVDTSFRRTGQTPVVVPQDIAIAPVTAKDGDYLSPSQFKEQISGILARELAIEPVALPGPGTVFAVDMPVSGLFQRNGTVHPARAGFVGRIADALMRRPPGVRYEMEIILASANAPGRGDDTHLLSQAGAAAEQFLRAGTPADGISVAIARGEPEMLRLQFTIREVDIAAPTKSGPIGQGGG